VKVLTLSDESSWNYTNENLENQPDIYCTPENFGGKKL